MINPRLLTLQLPPIKGPSEGYAPDPGADGAALQTAPGEFTKFASNLFGFLTIVAGLAFLLYFVLGALNWIMSSGDQQKVENAKNQLTSAAIGLIIVIAAYTIAGVIGSIFGFDILLNTPDLTIMKLGPRELQ